MQHPVPDHLTGTALEGRYELGPRIARGGTATVYRAVDLRLQRTVAVKLMHPHLAEDPAAAERFVREARSAARLSHPHVVSVLDQGHASDGVPYLVMEHVEGSTLRQVLRRGGAMTARQALEVMDPALDGLAAAHRAGLVHRDVKPENVLIADTGRVTVADFGLTRAVDQHTATGTVMGTVGYASPELVTGGRVGTRADVYSAGIVLFELLSGRRPFEGGPLTVARAHAEGSVPDLRSLDPGAPPDLARLVARATARDPERRPADAAHLLQELRAVRAGLSPAELDRAPGGTESAGARGSSPSAAPTQVLGAPAGPAFCTPTRAMGTPAAPTEGFGAPTEAFGTPGSPTEALTAPTEASGTAGGPTEVLGTRGAGRAHSLGPVPTPPGPPRAPTDPGPDANTAPAGPARRGTTGSSDPWRPELELRPSRPLRTAAVLALAALAVAAAAFLGWLLGTGPGGIVSVPEVRGTGPELAEQYLAGAGIDNVAVHGTSDPVAPVGTVIGTEPQASTPVRAAEQVVLLVSTGPEQVVAPHVEAMPVGDARARLTGAGLSAGAETPVFDDAPAGTVVGQQPAAGAAVVVGSPVDLEVSRGARPDTVPGVLGEPVDEAVRILQSQEYTVRVEETFGAPFGYVVRQTDEGTGVVLTVL